MSWLSEAEDRYGRTVTRDAGPSEDALPQCEHVGGCEVTVHLQTCSCKALICEDHGFLCDEGNCQAVLCDGCARRSDYDGKQRCEACGKLHNEVMQRRIVAA